jgi:hypothetical protein
MLHFLAIPYIEVFVQRESDAPLLDAKMTKSRKEKEVSAFNGKELLQTTGNPILLKYHQCLTTNANIQ